MPTDDRTASEFGDDVPLVFRVRFLNGKTRWGVVKPTDQPQYGRAIQMLDGEGFGWWYREKTLHESVSNLFNSGMVEDVEPASLLMPAD